MRSAWLRAPAALAAGFLLYGWVYVVWNGTVGTVLPRAALHLKHPMGFDDQPGPKVTWDGVLDGAYQRAEALRIGVFTPIYRDAVRWKNQFYYSVFGISGLPSIVIGRDGELLEKIYLDSLCRGAADASAGFAAAASSLRAAQDRLEARGQIFVYLMTPSKPAMYPEWLPHDYPCRGGTQAHDARLARWRAALARAGVRFADATAAVQSVRDDYPTPMFPRGGIHWNQVGAAVGTQSLIAAIGRPELLPAFSFSVAVTYRPEDDESDLLDTLNLRWPDRRYPVPRVTLAPAAGPCRPVRIAEATGSFMFKMNEVLEKSSCPPVIDMWFYWDLRRYEYVDGVRARSAPEPAMRDADLGGAQIVVLEENETGAGGTGQIAKFLAWEEARG